MIVSKKFIPSLKQAMFTATAVFALMRCSEEEIVAPVSQPTSTSEATANSEISIASLTVTGSNTTFATVADCKPCTYVVSEKEETLDGKLLGFKPGNIICLNKGVKYGNLEFINIEGTAQQPIVIATVGEILTSAASASSSEVDPY